MITKTENGSEIEFVENYTRKQDKEIFSSLFFGVKSTAKGEIDQVSVVTNVSKQSDLIVLHGVKTFKGKDMTTEVLDNMTKSDFAFAEKKCREIYDTIQKKKD